ncbi:MAG: signal peptidase I [Clostridiales bacterium]|nr:signal peptidase I [Clostridiales bacterium]
MRDGRQSSWKRKNAPYLIAMALAFIMVMVIAPEVNEGNAMDPTVKDGQVLVMTKSSYSVKRQEPDKGKVVVLEKTVAPKVSEDNIIARVIGLPGDKIKIKDGRVFVNGREYVTETGIKGAGNAKDATYKLKGNDVYLLCDNRDEYIDSRNEKLGPVDMRDIRGTVFLRIWPLSDLGGID